MNDVDLRAGVLFLLNLTEQNLQLTNLSLHAVHKPKFDEMRAKLGAPYQPASIGGVPFAMVPEGPGCSECGRRPTDLVANGHGPHAS